MTTHEPPLSLTDLSTAGVVLGHADAVTLVRELALRVSRGQLPGVPSAHVIRLFPSGTLSVEGPVAADDRTVARAAHLLDTLLPGFDAPSDQRVPGALRLVIARALGTLDLPAYSSLESFASALERFGSSDLEATVREIFARRTAVPARRQDDTALAAVMTTAPAAPRRFEPNRRSTDRARLDSRPERSPLTISDIRRARRATGLTLAEISRRSRISTRLLCELEWGYLRNWPDSHFGRRQLVRYARAAGLDDQLVVRTVWPLLEESVRARGGQPIAIPEIPATIEIEVETTTPAQTAIAILPRTSAPTQSWRSKALIAALAIPALLAIGIAPAVWERSQRHAPAAEQRVSTPRDAAPPSVHSGAPVQEARAAAREATASTEVAHSVPRRHESTAPAHVAAPDRSRAMTQVGGSVDAHPAVGIPDGTTYSPSFASVGSAMFYQAESKGASALMRADTDGQGSILRITSIVDDHARNFHARPSPDGRRIAFDSDREGERAVYVADADGKNVTRISGDGFAAIPSWSPDGTTIAFVRAEPDRPKVWNLWTADLSTGRTRRLTSYRVGQPWGGSWFPDGGRLAYSHEERLVVMDLEKGTQRVYPSPVKGRLVRTPAVSPDGKRVMFQVYHDGTWLLELADGSMRKVLSDPSAEEYTWAPDGRRVAYHSRNAGGWGVWLMAAR